MNREQYFLMCEQLGTEPLDSEVPAEFSDFPFEVQEVINIFSILPDKWEGMSGTYMGKDYSILPYLFDNVFEVLDVKVSMKLLLVIDRIVKEQYAQKQAERNRKNKTKSSKGGISVQG